MLHIYDMKNLAMNNVISNFEHSLILAGDFAMLLKTGMKVKQALFYNGLSSILCFVGMLIGVSLGNVNSATNWVFAGTAGMFLYIALVDMVSNYNM